MSLAIQIRQCKQLTPTEQTIADYVLQHPAEVPRMTSAQLAEKNFVSQAAISRFCKKIGLPGFAELKFQLAVEQNAVEQNRQNIDQANEITAEDSIAQVMQKLNSMSVEALRETQRLQSVPVLTQIQQSIQKAQVLDFYGCGASHFVALDANYKFMRVGKHTTALALLDQQLVQAQNSNPSHLAFLFSYSGETEEMLKIAQILSHNEVPMVSVTKNNANRLLKLARHNLFVADKEGFYRSAAIYSRMSMLHVVDILYSIYVNLDYEGTLATLAKNMIQKEIR